MSQCVSCQITSFTYDILMWFTPGDKIQIKLIKDEIETELSHQTHTYVLLLRQLFMQAENWHLKLQADISELENK